MKTKIILTTIVTLISFSINAQIKVKSDGKVLVGSGTLNPGSSLEIQDHNKTTEVRIFATSPNIARLWAMNKIYSFGLGVDASGKGHIYRNVNTPGYVMSFNSAGNVSIGTSNLYSSYKLFIRGNFKVSGQVICRDGYWASSDVRMKSNVSPINGALNKVMNLNGKTYNLKSTNLKSATNSDKINYGLIAQEVQEIIPELVMETEDSISSFAINYDGLIPVLIEAIKEQQNTIDKLKTEVENLKFSSTTDINESNSNFKSKLYQNAPNPFNEQTTISYFLKGETNKAVITVYDMQGTPVKSIVLNSEGEGTVNISASELKPGMYMYSLISDEKLIDTKTMIIIN